MALIARIRNATRVVGVTQGFLGLPLRDIVCKLPDGRDCPAMLTAWELTPEELMKLQIGEPLIVRMLGTAPPPMNVYVGDD